MSIPVWQIPPVDIAKAVEAVRIVQLGEQMLDERAKLDGQLSQMRHNYHIASKGLSIVRKYAMDDDAVGHYTKLIPAHEHDVCTALDEIWTAQENIKRWEAWFG